jgi:hypothetical protein
MRKELIDDTAKELDYDFKEIDRLLCLTDEEAGYLIANSPYLSRRETLTRKQVFDRYGVYIDYESEDEIIRHPTIPNLFGIRKGLEL